jgi:putative phage-type endonuclease
MAQPAIQITSPYEVVCDTSVEQNWLDARMRGIGASEIAIVLGEAPTTWGSPLSLYAQKIDKYERDLSDVEAVYWGRKLESPILEAYWERTGRRTEKESLLLRSTEHPWMLCTLDGRTWEPANDGARWPLEIKNVSAFKAEEWVDGPPPHYYLQIQQQMAVTGEPKATIAALLGGQRMVWADVPRDEDTIRKIVYHGSRFWDRVQRRDMPAPDGTEGSRRALQALYPEGHGITVLPYAAIEAADELERLKSDLRALEKRKDEIENTLRAALGDSEVGMLTDGRSFSWKLQTRRECVMPATSFRVLRLHHSKGRK